MVIRIVCYLYTLRCKECNEGRISTSWHSNGVKGLLGLVVGKLLPTDRCDKHNQSACPTIAVINTTSPPSILCRIWLIRGGKEGERKGLGSPSSFHSWTRWTTALTASSPLYSPQRSSVCWGSILSPEECIVWTRTEQPSNEYPSNQRSSSSATTGHS